MSHRATGLVLVLAGAAVACGSSAAIRPRPPTYAPAGETKTRAIATTPRPLIVEWPSADRAALEARLRRGLVLVRYEAGAMEVLDRCAGPGAYEYTPVTRKRDRIAIHDERELETEIPLGAAPLGAKLASSGQLEVTTTIVGRHEASRVSVASQELTGDRSLRVEVVPVGCPKGTRYELQRGCVVGSSPSPATTTPVAPRARIVGPCSAAKSLVDPSQASCGDATSAWCDTASRRVACYPRLFAR